MATRPRILSLCSGVGQLDAGVRRALPSARTVLYVEREAYAAAVLVARMESGDLDEAPVWSDAEHVPTGTLHGRVDMVLGGIPCQPFSRAGERRGWSATPAITLSGCRPLMSDDHNSRYRTHKEVA